MHICIVYCFRWVREKSIRKAALKNLRRRNHQSCNGIKPIMIIHIISVSVGASEPGSLCDEDVDINDQTETKHVTFYEEGKLASPLGAKLEEVRERERERCSCWCFNVRAWRRLRRLVWPCHNKGAAASCDVLALATLLSLTLSLCVI